MKKIMWIALIVLFLLVNIAFIALYLQNKKAPTVGLNRGHTSGQLTPLPKTPNAISSQTSDLSKYVDPLPFKKNLEKTMDALTKSVQAHGGGDIITQESNYLYVIFTSNIFKFKDDVEFYLDEPAQKVHIRSASRAGKSDLGVNLKRYKALTKIYSKQD